MELGASIVPADVDHRRRRLGEVLRQVEVGRDQESGPALEGEVLDAEALMIRYPPHALVQRGARRERAESGRDPLSDLCDILAGLLGRADRREALRTPGIRLTHARNVVLLELLRVVVIAHWFPPNHMPMVSGVAPVVRAGKRRELLR